MKPGRVSGTLPGFLLDRRSEFFQQSFKYSRSARFSSGANTF
jgi:hypothetical protein